MSFNLKKYADKKKINDGDKLNEVKLQQEHSSAPNSITQKQLERDRVKEKGVLTEKLLEKKRLGGAEKILEKRLDDSTSKLVKHRNSKAYAGNLNKVEEQRISKSKQEDEKYVPASKSPKGKRWWDSLKATASNKKTVKAQVESLVFDEKDRWKRVQDAHFDEDEEKPMDNILSPEEMVIEETGGQPLELQKVQPVESPIARGLYIVYDIKPEGKKLSLGQLKELAYSDAVGGEYSYLGNIDEFSPDSFNVVGDTIVARLVGDEYYPSGQQESVLDESVDNPFYVEDVQETEVDGVVIGSVSVDPSYSDMVSEMDEDDIRRQVLDAISVKNPDLEVEEDGIDLKDLSDGSIKFVGQDRLFSAKDETVVEDEILAKNDFNIVVLSDTKKK